MKLPKFSKKQLLILLAIAGPGIITSAVDNDAGGIATYSVAGANFGYSLLWTIIPIGIMLVIIQEMSARLAVVTGKGLGDLVRENFGLKITLLLVACLVLTNMANTISEFAGITAAAEIFGISRFVAVPLSAIFVWLLITKGNYKSVEKAFLLATVFYIAYVIVGIMAHPNPSIIIPSLLIPSIQFNPAYFLILTALVGTTIAPWMQFYLMAAINEKGIRIEEYKYARLDVIFGSIVTMIVAFFIIVSTAAVLHTNGIQVNTADDAAKALVPLAGQYAGALFAFGLLSASLFAAAILPLAISFNIAEIFGWERGVDKKISEAPQFYFIFTATIAISAIVILIPNLPLIPIMIISQAMNGILLPIMLFFMMKLVNSKKLMGNYVNSKKYNILSWGCVGLLAIMSIGLGLSVLFQ